MTDNIEEKRTYTRIDELHNSPDTAIIINDYPWGFRLRTSIRYWIETTKRGDRFCSQTIDPRTGRYCTPKKSTYADVMVMTRDDRGYISFMSWSPYSLEELNTFLDFCKDYPFSPAQEEKIKRGRAYLKTMQHVTYTVRTTKYRHKETGEISDCINIMELDKWEEIKEPKEDQEEIKKNLNKAYGFYLHEEGLL